MSLLTIIANACAESNVPIPSSVIGNTDNNVVQMLRLLNREGRWYQRIHDWDVLRREGSFTTLAANTQIADLTSFTDASSASVTDFDRFVPDTMFNRTAVQRIIPMTAMAYQRDRASSITGIYPRYTVRGGALVFSPVPTAGQSVYFEYVSKNWAETSGGTGKTEFTLDTDVGVIDEELLTQALLWRFLKAKGLDYAEEFRRCELIYSALTGQQMPMPDLMGSPGDTSDMSGPYVPETGFGV